MADPPSVPNPDRVPVTEAHRRGVSDPMTASLMRVPGNGDPSVRKRASARFRSSTAACATTFSWRSSGWTRRRRRRAIKARPWSARFYFAPIAGHVPDRAAIRYLTELRDIEVWLAPIAGTRVMVPYRASVPTPIGVGCDAGDAFRLGAAHRPGRRESAVTSARAGASIRSDGPRTCAQRNVCRAPGVSSFTGLGRLPTRLLPDFGG